MLDSGGWKDTGWRTRRTSTGAQDGGRSWPETSLSSTRIGLRVLWYVWQGGSCREVDKDQGCSVLSAQCSRLTTHEHTCRLQDKYKVDRWVGLTSGSDHRSLKLGRFSAGGI